MSRYVAIAPNGISVTISLPNTSLEIKHGTIIENDFIANSYPTIFKKIDTNVPVVQEVVKEMTKVESKDKQDKPVKTETKTQTKKPKKNMFVRG